ncbi:hypothetical protein F5890DRAFT_337473 [Lentinula detonsa]|uniref:Uncharacterized protein n=1 Tax=Lentinula detonsa TaxID=2804962 RepID=A0AA38PWI4_9AGAR|nr:hypothetical protein F5890DRAFT_337473 [Lentinula detonsa]
MSSTTSTIVPSKFTALSKPMSSSPNSQGTSAHSIHTHHPTTQSPPLPSSSSSPPVLPSKINRSHSSPSSKAAVANIASNFIVKIRRGAHAMGAHSRRASDLSSHSSFSSSDEEKDDDNRSQPTALNTPTKHITGPKTRLNHSTWRCSSGPPLTTSSIAPDQQNKRVEYKDTFVCSGGVNLPLLLRATRASLVEVAESQAGIGVGFRSVKKVVLDNEEWRCKITGPPLQPVSPPSTPTTTSPIPVSKSTSASPYPSSSTKARSLDSSYAFPSQASVTLSPTKTNKNARKYKVHIHYYAYAMIASPANSPTLGRNDYNQPVALERAREGSIRGLMTVLSRSEPDY